MVVRNAKAILLLAFFFIYFGLELSFNLLLVDVYSLPLEDLFGDKHHHAARLELFGRMLSGFGLSLAIVSFVPVQKLLFWKKEQASSLPGKQSLVVKGLAFLLLWVALVPSLRLFVDGWAHATSSDAKLSAVRAIAYREAYLNDLVEIDRFDEFNAIASDEARRDLVIALLPSLAFSSTGFNALIERNVEAMADTLLSNRQKSQFAKEGLPRLREFDALYQSELRLYMNAQKKRQQALSALNDIDTLEAETAAHVDAIYLYLENSWKRYVTGIDETYDDIKQYASNDSIQDAHRQFKDQYRDECKSQVCKDNVKVRHANWLNELDIPMMYVTPDDILFTLYGTEERVRSILRKGRKNALRYVYHVDEDIEEYEQWLLSPGGSEHARLYLAERGVALAEHWQLQNTSAIFRAVTQKYQSQVDKVWPEYLQGSQFKVQNSTMGRYDFSLLPIVEKKARSIMGRFYLTNFTPGESESAYLQRWLKSQDNISFIRMLSSTAAEAAFSKGGGLYQIGVDAVKLSIVPQTSILLSFIAVFALAIKFIVQLFKGYPKFYAVFLIGVMTIVLVVPTVKSVTDSHSYSAMMANFSEEFHKDDPVSRVKMKLFGVALDLENGVFTAYRHNPAKQLVAAPLFHFQKNEKGEVVESTAVTSLRYYDDAFNTVFSFLPSHVFGFSERDGFNANVSLIKPDNSIAAYMGIEMAGNKVKSVAIPNFLASTDLGFLAEQAFILKHDPLALTLDYISNYDSPEYWVEIANGRAFRSTLIEKLEAVLPGVIEGNTRLRKLLESQVKKGKANILLYQATAGAKYQCFVMPTLTSTDLANALLSNQVDYEKIEDCWIEI